MGQKLYSIYLGPVGSCCVASTYNTRVDLSGLASSSDHVVRHHLHSYKMWFWLHDGECELRGAGRMAHIASLLDCGRSLKAMLLLVLVVSLYVGLFELHFGMGLLIHRSIWTRLDCPRIGSPFLNLP